MCGYLHVPLGTYVYVYVGSPKLRVQLAGQKILKDAVVCRRPGAKFATGGMWLSLAPLWGLQCQDW